MSNSSQNDADYRDQLLRQYDLYVRMADKISDRRDKANSFYTTLLAGGFALLSAVVASGRPDNVFAFLALLGVGFVGLGLCWVWYINLQSYRQLNGAKFKVIHKMEEDLPLACYDLEWDLLGRGKDPAQYRPLSQVEKRVPVILAIPYVFLILYSVAALCSRVLRVLFALLIIP